MTEEAKYWLEYKCVKCGYTSTDTDVCRKCMRGMMPTGYEEKLTKTLKVKRRKVNKESCLYNKFLFSRGISRLECERTGEKLPEWYPDFIGGSG